MAQKLTPRNTNMKQIRKGGKQKKQATPNAKILITGGAGFIGSHMVEYLFDTYPSYELMVLDALTYAGDMRNIPDHIQESKRFSFWYGDIRNAKIVEHLVSRADYVIHFAAETHVARSIYDDENFFMTDVIGTQRIANAVLNNRKTVKRLIHISTSEVYGTALKAKMNEDHPLNPQSPYAAAKAGADRLIYSYVATYKIPAVIIRPFNAYGPRQHLEKLIPRFITNCITSDPLTIHGTGNSSRDFTHVRDIARAIDLILHAPAAKVDGEVFNIASGTHRSVRQIADLILKLMKRADAKEALSYTSSTPMVNYGDRPGQVYRHTGDASKLREVLGWKPEVEFTVGLEEVVAWYRENQWWWKTKLWMRHVPIETEEGKIELH